MTLQLYINDELVDLSDDSPMALTYQINNLAEVKNQQGNTSNQFKLPLTQRNRRILGFPDEVAFTNEMPYRQYAAKVVQDGLEIIPYGTGELNGIEQDTAAITILSGNVDFFDAIEGKLYDMGDETTTVGGSKLFKPYEHAWNVQNVVQSQTKTEGWIWPVIDYGKMPADLTGMPNIDVRYLRPGFFLKTAVDLIVRSAGYSIHPDSFLVKDELFNNLIIQFANDSFEHGTDYQNGTGDPLSCEVRTGAPLTYGNTNVYSGTMPFTNVVKDPSGLWFHSDESYKAPAGVSASVALLFPSIIVMGNPSQHNNQQQTIGIEIRLKMYNAGGNTELTRTYIDLSDNAQQINQLFWQYEAKNVKLSYELDLAKEDHIYVEYYITNNKKGAVVIKEGASLTITSKKQSVLYGQQIQCERILPDISMKDLLKDTLQRFGIICQTDSTRRTIRFASFSDIVANIPRAVNWSAKCLDQGKSISFQLGGYAQVNYMKYKADDAVLPATLGQSQINVDDKTLPATTDLFESQFAASLERPFIDGTTAQILKVAPNDDSNDFSISTQPRLLIYNKLELKGRQIRFTDGDAANDVVVNDFVCTPYFNKPGTPYNLTFDYLCQTYYPELEKILHRSKKVVRYFLLTPRDILELDLLIPVYLQQDGAYYYINKIDAWRKGQPVKVELVKWGDDYGHSGRGVHPIPGKLTITFYCIMCGIE